MAGTSAEDQGMQDFVRGLFQGSPDLSTLTHAIVRKKYLAHVGQQTLTKEEKEKLKCLVEEELVQMQVDDPPSSGKVLTKLETLVKSGGQKRHLCTSDTSSDEVKSSREQKKQRTGKELKVSSDEQDSGIDSKKMPVYGRPRSAGKFSGTLDEGDSGAEDHSDGSGSNRKSTKKERREAGGRKASQEHQSGRQRGRSGSESEDSKREEGQERRAKIRSQDESESWEELEDDSEEDTKRKKVTPRKQGSKNVKVGESESDSDNTGDSRRKKEAPQTKRRGADKEKQGYKLESDSEDEEEPERWIGKKGMTKTQRKNMSRKELAGEQVDSERGCAAKQERKQKPKRTESSSDESEMGTDGSKTLLHKRGGSRTSSSEGGESQSEADTAGSKSRQPPGSSSESESGSENNEVEDRGKKRMVKKRSKGESGSKDEKSKGKATAKPQKESVSEMESEEESDDSGSESEEKRKSEGRQKKGTPKPRRRRSSKGASENELDEEKGDSSLEENPRNAKQRHRGKDREHSGKSDDHPSIQRLKRYIRECGVHKNYKKLLAGCRSRRAQVEALKKELENIGLKGTPSLAKCKALKRKREEAAEVASLDLSNIITTEGRPRRRNVWSLYSKPQESPSSPEESPIRRPATDWSHLRGVISSDGESS